MIGVQNSAFVKSCELLAQAPMPDRVEIAFLGRSNVGKSSLINLLLRAKLAKSSATPGKTRLINFYSTDLIKDALKIPLFLVDLPGFGYAKVSKSEQQKWQENLLLFCKKRSNIKLFCLLIDSRHMDLELDKEVFTFFNSIILGDQKIIKIYTKIDKLKKAQISDLKAKNALLGSNARGFSENSFKQIWEGIFKAIF